MKKCFDVGEIKNYTKRSYIKIRPYIKPFLVVFIIYFVALSSMLRANYSYMDDTARAVYGYAWTTDFNRISSSLLSYLLNVNTGLSDISPLPQVVAIVFLSLTSILLAHVFCRGKIRYLPLMMTTFIGLTPFMYGCWVYKFDAPCMALSILVSVIPLLFWSRLSSLSLRRKLIALLASVLCLLIMWTSYQASSGVIIVFVLCLAMIDWLRKADIGYVSKKLMFYFVAYVASIVLFKLFFPDTNGDSYRETEVFAVAELVSGVILNIKNVLGYIAVSLNKNWSALLLIVFLGFMFAAICYGVKHIGLLKTLPAIIVMPVLMFVFSYGAYLVLKDAPTLSRSMVGVGAYLAAIAIATFVLADRLTGVVIAFFDCALLYSFLVCGLAFGNGLASQKEYARFRIQQLTSELVKSNVDISSGSKKLRLIGDIGNSAVAQRAIGVYPILDKTFKIQTGLNDRDIWGYRQLITYYGVNVVADIPREVECNSVISSSRYYDIETDYSKNICVTIK